MSFHVRPRLGVVARAATVTLESCCASLVATHHYKRSIVIAWGCGHRMAWIVIRGKQSRPITTRSLRFSDLRQLLCFNFQKPIIRIQKPDVIRTTHLVNLLSSSLCDFAMPCESACEWRVRPYRRTLDSSFQAPIDRRESSGRHTA